MNDLDKLKNENLSGIGPIEKRIGELKRIRGDLRGEARFQVDRRIAGLYASKQTLLDAARRIERSQKGVNMMNPENPI